MSETKSYRQLSREFIELWQSGVNEIEAYTSGSTGTPKRIMLPRRLMEESAMRSIRHFGLDETSTVHLALSPEYIAGKMCIVRALTAGCKLTFEEPSSYPLTAADTPSVITLLSAVGAQIPAMAHLAQTGNLPHIEHLLLGGAPLTADMRQAAGSLADNVWESYGMTETASHIALRRVSNEPEPFRPLPGITVGSDSRGCLTIDMPTAGLIITNDIVELHDDNRFFILGRADNVLISGGLKVMPETVEQRLSSYLPGQTFYITSQPHPKWGEQIVLIIENPQAAAETCVDSKEYILGQESLYELSHRLLKPHERPARVFVTRNIPRTSSGKIIRQKL